MRYSGELGDSPDCYEDNLKPFCEVCGEDYNTCECNIEIEIEEDYE